MPQEAPPRADELVLVIAGQAFSGWESVALARALEVASGTFSVQVSSEQVLRVRTGQEVSVELAGRPVLRGFVDELEVVAGPRERLLLTISGRDRTADLVDCSATAEPGEWEELQLPELANELAEPFGVEIRFEGGDPGEPFARFKLNPGETAWSAVERACRLRGYLAYSSGDGALVIARPGRNLAAAELVEGPRGNVLRYRLSRSTRDRYQVYTVRGQSPGADDYFGDQVAAIEGSSRDPSVERFRPLIVLAEGALTFESAEDRANWEASVRAARGTVVTAEVQGWRQVPRTGPPWDLNELVRVLIPRVGLDQVLLVSGVRFTRDRQEGTRTELTLTRRDAYNPAPEVDPAEELEWGEEED